MFSMAELKRSVVAANGIEMYIAEQGDGPLVLLCHGFPESWYSWRDQLSDLAEAGFRAVAPDMRGYGQTEVPQSIDQYTLLHLVGDMVGLLDALGAEKAVIAGHDWGAPVAWHAALLRPDRFRGVIGLSVPLTRRPPVHPTMVMPKTEDSWFYQLYFQQPGLAEAEFERDPRHAIRTLLLAASGEGRSPTNDGAVREPFGMVSRRDGLLKPLKIPSSLPAWLSEADVDFYAGEFARHGFRGGLNWYRNMDRNWELLACIADKKVTVPALFMVGERDVVFDFPGMRETIARLPERVPLLRETIVLPGCGHWTQQERAADVSAAMIRFLKDL
jgi:pimeloyl-ACP methyl ester carboxylesterase